MIKTKCHYCDKVLYRFPYRFKRNKHHFCNYKCMGKFATLTKKKERSCNNCNRTIKVILSSIKNNKHHFCCKKCRIEYQVNRGRKNIKCEWCNGIFRRRKFQIKKHKHYFCSNECHGKWNSKYSVGKKSPSWKNKTKKISCSHCKKLVIRSYCTLKNNKYHFCSRECQHQFMIGKNSSMYNSKKFLCDFCKKTIFLSESQVKNKKHHFCCRECFYKFNRDKNHYLYNSKEVLCDFCKKTLVIKPTVIKKYKHHFCDQECYEKFTVGKNHPSWNNGSSFEPYGTEFDNKLRDFIRKRDKYKCQNPECGIPEKECFRKLDCHHIDYNKKNNDPINLIALCGQCNKKANANRRYWQTYYENIQIKRRVHELEKYVN